MGMKLFSDVRTSPALGDPDPRRFRIISLTVVGVFTIAQIEYPSCTPAERLKLLVYEGDVRAALETAKRIDPHFSADTPAPIARFKASPGGQQMALHFAETASAWNAAK